MSIYLRRQLNAIHGWRSYAELLEAQLDAPIEGMSELEARAVPADVIADWLRAAHITDLGVAS